MPHIIRDRKVGATWFGSIFLIDEGKHIQGYLEGENMNRVVVYPFESREAREPVISEGRLRVRKGYDQGRPASFLVYLPNKKKYPNQEMIPIKRVV